MMSRVTHVSKNIQNEEDEGNSDEKYAATSMRLMRAQNAYTNCINNIALQCINDWFE